MEGTGLNYLNIPIHCDILEYGDQPGPLDRDGGKLIGVDKPLWNRLTFPLQAWRKYDTDRSGYIEANELR